MFTPPPSPGQKHEIKARISRRFRWVALVGPLLLILITLSTRYITHPALFDALSGESTHSVWSPHKRHLYPRDSSTSSAPTSTTPATAQPVPTVPTSAVIPTPFPQPFDGNMPQNFSSTSCFNFFSNMTSADPFRSCRPLSLLLQTSTILVQVRVPNFVLISHSVQAQKNLTLLNSIIWGTCQTTLSFQQCSANMAWFANALRSECAQDISENNTNVVTTLIGVYFASYCRMRSFTATSQVCRPLISCIRWAVYLTLPRIHIAILMPCTTQTLPIFTFTNFPWVSPIPTHRRPPVQHVQRLSWTTTSTHSRIQVQALHSMSSSPIIPVLSKTLWLVVVPTLQKACLALLAGQVQQWA